MINFITQKDRLSISIVILFNLLCIELADFVVPASAMGFEPLHTVASSRKNDGFVFTMENTVFFILIERTNQIVNAHI